MDTFRPIWFFETRMTLWGFGLGAWLGAMYGLILGAALFAAFPPSLLFGPLLGGAYGAISGLALGIMEGAVLWAITLLLHRRSKPRGANQYGRVAGWACAGACVMALAFFFELTARGSGTSLLNGPSYDSNDVISLLIVIVGPSLVAAGAAWWAGRRVAGRYMEEFGEPVSRGPAQATGESLMQKERRR